MKRLPAFLTTSMVVLALSEPLLAQGVPDFPPVRVPAGDRSTLERLLRCANYRPPSRINLLERPFDDDLKTCFDFSGQVERINAQVRQLRRNLEQLKFGNEGRTEIQEFYWDLP